jgi:O-antigen/teichoic acid export membrane protein
MFGMKMGQFVRDTAFTAITGILTFVIGLSTSIILARLLGPEGRGVYAMATLLPSLIVTFVHLGIGPATVFYTAKGYYSQREILGSNILLSFIVGIVGLIAGFIVILFRESLFPNIAYEYLLIALGMIPLNLFFWYLRYILLGVQRFKEYNMMDIFQSLFFLVLIALALWSLGMGVRGALLAGIFAWILTDIVVFFWAHKVAGGISLKPNVSYLKDAVVYGAQAHLASILGFLNYRVDMFLVNWFLNPVAVGFYAISVGLVEKLWLISQAASVVLFPKVAAEADELRRKEFTPLITRTILWATALAALILFFLTYHIIALLYSEAFIPSVRPLQILLPGIVALSVWRLLANDLAGRGRPMLNTYITGIAVLANVWLNVLLIPKYGIEGAAWASTASYGIAFLVILFVYCRISGNSWAKVLLPQRGDWALYRRTAETLVRGVLRWVSKDVF